MSYLLLGIPAISSYYIYKNRETILFKTLNIYCYVENYFKQKYSVSYIKKNKIKHETVVSNRLISLNNIDFNNLSKLNLTIDSYITTYTIHDLSIKTITNFGDYEEIIDVFNSNYEKYLNFKSPIISCLLTIKDENKEIIEINITQLLNDFINYDCFLNLNSKLNTKILWFLLIKKHYGYLILKSLKIENISKYNFYWQIISLKENNINEIEGQNITIQVNEGIYNQNLITK